VANTGNRASNGEETAGRGPRDSASLLQRLGEGVSVWDPEVTRAWAITPTMRRLLRWAAAAQPGAHVEAIGPRGKITVDPSADWHLFAGDDSAIPASLAMAESLPTANHAVVVLEVDGEADEQQARTLDGPQIPVHWLHRDGTDPASSANRWPRFSTSSSPAEGPCLPGRRARGGVRTAAHPPGTWVVSRPDLGQALLAGRDGQRLPRRARAAIAESAGKHLGTHRNAHHQG
jgi:hypothetical protein